VLRGGYGILWLPGGLKISGTSTNNPVATVSTVFVSSLDGGVIRRSGTFDGSRIGDRSRIAHRLTFGIAGFSRPHGDDLGLAGFGGTIRLLTRAIGDFRRTHGHSGTVHSQIHGGRHFPHLFYAAMFIGSDLGAQRFGGSLYLLDAYAHASQLLQQRTTLREAHQRRRTTGHPQNSGGEREQLHAQRTIPRTESGFTLGTGVISSAQVQGTRQPLKRLVMASVILGLPSAGAGQFRPCIIGGVGVEPLRQGARGQPQSLPSRCHFHRFEIQIGDGLVA
jgi:hypothetical protein